MKTSFVLNLLVFVMFISSCTSDNKTKNNLANIDVTKN